MVYKPDYLRNIERSRELKRAQKWAVTLICAFIGLGLFVSELRRILKTADLMNYGYMALFVMTGTLIFSWILSTQKEFDLLLRWLDPERYEPPSGIKETGIILGLAILLIVLLFVSRNPLWYSFAFSVYSIVAYYGGKLLQKELSDVFEKSKERARKDLTNPDIAKKAELYITLVDNLEFYFIRRPHEKRLWVIAICSVLGLVTSVCWAATGIGLLGFGAYMVFVVILIISETVIWRWRSIRDNLVRPIKAELYELTRENSRETRKS